MGDLSRFTNIYRAQEASDPNAPVPPATYQTVISKVKHEETQKGKDVIKFQLKVLDGPQKGKIIFADRYMEGKTDESTATLQRMFKQDMIICGHEELEPVDFMAPALKIKCLIGVGLEVKVEQDGDFTRVRFKKRFEVGTDGTVGAGVGGGNGTAGGRVLQGDVWGASTDFNPSDWNG